MKELSFAEVEQVSGAGFVADTAIGLAKELGQWVGNYLETLPFVSVINDFMAKIFGQQSSQK